ncbi:MAG: DUF6273 domain-containing protein [Defluviitaleaceae bacterium]|nr:DUF6273 domain-containing protein [Defluviitaleaceae bacterium]
MRDTIRHALQDRTAASAPIKNLINIALDEMDALTRLRDSSSRNMQTDVNNLARELCKKYFIEENAARMVIESIAELLGYVPPADCETCAPLILVDSVKINDTVAFGDYNWRVLDVQNDMALLLSAYIIEQRAYHPCYEGVTWETSKLRAYLNSDFIERFDEAEKGHIVETLLNNPPNLWYDINGGNDTRDRIFILSLEEVDKYFGDSGDYANKRRKKYDGGKWVSDEKGWILSNGFDNDRAAEHNGLASFWWLRSPGYSEYTIAYVSTTGNIPLNGDRVCIGRGGVRPAMWVKLATVEA